MPLNSGNSSKCSRRAASKSPASAACTIALTRSGSRLATTLITPVAPMAISGRVSESSPDTIASLSPHRDATSEALSSEPVASFTATIIGCCASRAVVCGDRATPVRPGML